MAVASTVNVSRQLKCSLYTKKYKRSEEMYGIAVGNLCLLITNVAQRSHSIA